MHCDKVMVASLWSRNEKVRILMHFMVLKSGQLFPYRTSLTLYWSGFPVTAESAWKFLYLNIHIKHTEKIMSVLVLKKKITRFRYFSRIKGKFRIHPCINIQHSYNMHSVNRQRNLLHTTCQPRFTIASLWSRNYKVRIPLHLISQIISLLRWVILHLWFLSSSRKFVKIPIRWYSYGAYF